MSDWKPTIGKWDAPEQYNMKDPIWKSALTYAESKLNAVNAKLTYKDGRTTKDIPCIEFIQQVLAALIQEANKHDDYTLLIAALCRLQERAGCSYQEIADKYTDNLCTVLKEFVCTDFMNLDTYLERSIRNSGNHYVRTIVLAEVLCYLRLEKCPREDWRADLEYYSRIERVIDSYCSPPSILTVKIKEQLLKNKEISRRINLTDEELYEGWDE